MRYALLFLLVGFLFPGSAKAGAGDIILQPASNLSYFKMSSSFVKDVQRRARRNSRRAFRRGLRAGRRRGLRRGRRGMRRGRRGWRNGPGPFIAGLGAAIAAGAAAAASRDPYYHRSCAIKGYIGPFGGRLFIRPGQPGYHSVGAVRYFCSGRQARRHGYSPY